MQMNRRFTREGQDAFAGLSFVPRTSRIVNPNGSVVFEMTEISVPEGWSQVAVDILAQKYFRKAGVPARLKRFEEETVPSWLWRSEPDEAALAALPDLLAHAAPLLAPHGTCLFLKGTKADDEVAAAQRAGWRFEMTRHASRVHAGFRRSCRRRCSGLRARRRTG